MAVWNTSGATVFSGVSPVGWTTLDLTVDTGMAPTGLPSQRVLAFLVVAATGADNHYAFRPDGSADDYYDLASYSQGCSQGKAEKAPQREILLAITTSSAGKVEWQSQAAQTTTVTLAGWVEAAFDDEKIHDALVPVAWTDVDASAATGSNKSLIFATYEMKAGASDWIGVRPNGDADDFLDDGGTARGAMSQIQPAAASEFYSVMIPTDSSGIYEHASKAASCNCEAVVVCHETTGWYPDGSVVFSSAAPPTSWTDLDLGTELDSRRGFVFLKIERAGGAPGVSERVAFRPNGSSIDTLLASATYPGGCSFCSLEQGESTIIGCETDASGVVEWIAGSNTYNFELTLLGFFSVNTLPSYSAKFPITTVAPDTNVSVTISDDDQIVQASIDLDLTDPHSVTHNVIINGVFQSGYSGTITANGSNGYDILLNSHDPFVVGKWDVDVYSEDDLKGESTTWSFIVAANAPSVRLTDPNSGEVVLVPPPNILISVEDDWGIDTSTIDLTAVSAKREEISIISGGVFQAGYSGTIQVNGYTGVDIIVFWPDLENAINWTFTLDLTSIVEVDL